MSQYRIKVETRWPVVAAIIIVTTTLSLMRARIQILPPWAYYTLPLLLIIPMLGVQLGKNKSFWLNIEKFTTITDMIIFEYEIPAYNYMKRTYPLNYIFFTLISLIIVRNLTKFFFSSSRGKPVYRITSEGPTSNTELST